MTEVRLVVDTQGAVGSVQADVLSQHETNQRPPPKYFCVLLPVWGRSYITQFLERSLPTLAADGNLPALARALPTRFVFLTRKDDKPAIQAHRAYLGLRQICAIDFLLIDDLIMQANHSTTITLAWERAVRREGAAMLDTCFVFLVSDYVMADGSLATIAERMLAGADAIQAGNFQLDEEIAEAWLHERLAVAGASLSLASREMVHWGLSCLHPATLANTVNYPLYHNAHTNRLFWHVDRDTMIGRFYLLHQICIRPQRTDFVIASASDYSFVAEMCPTGNVVILTDSDDYFVTEVQPPHHESKLIRLGPQSIDDLVECLSEWTNRRHRLNAEHTIIFHANDLPASLPEARAETDRFIAKISSRLGKEQPFRNHPYWIGATAGLHAPIAKGWSTAVTAVRTNFVQWARSVIVGQIPNVGRVHPRWRDYRIMLAACDAIADPWSRLLIESSDLTGIGEALRQRVPNTVPFTLWRSSRDQPIMPTGDKQFDAAFIGLVNEGPSEIEPGLRRLAAALRPGGQIIVAMVNTDSLLDLDHAGRAYAGPFAALDLAGLTATECRIGAISWWRWWANASCARAVKQLALRRHRLVPLIWLRIVLWGGPALVANVFSSFWPQNSSASSGIVSSLLIRLTVEAEGDESIGAACLTQENPLPSHWSTISRGTPHGFDHVDH
jgi:hypothetical protein